MGVPVRYRLVVHGGQVPRSGSIPQRGRQQCRANQHAVRRWWLHRLLRNLRAVGSRAGDGGAARACPRRTRLLAPEALTEFSLSTGPASAGLVVRGVASVRIANASADGAVLVTDLACRAILQEN